MQPPEASLAIRVDSDRKPMAVVITIGSRLVAQVSISQVRRIIEQIDRLSGDRNV